jgi:hypothetical protein
MKIYRDNSEVLIFGQDRKTAAKQESALRVCTMTVTRWIH